MDDHLIVVNGVGSLPPCQTSVADTHTHCQTPLVVLVKPSVNTTNVWLTCSGGSYSATANHSAVRESFVKNQL